MHGPLLWTLSVAGWSGTPASACDSRRTLGGTLSPSGGEADSRVVVVGNYQTAR